MEDGLERLERRCKHLIKGSRSYKDTVQILSANQMGFADSLEEFCGGTDEESLILGMHVHHLGQAPSACACHIWRTLQGVQQVLCSVLVVL